MDKNPGPQFKIIVIKCQTPEEKYIIDPLPLKFKAPHSDDI